MNPSVLDVVLYLFENFLEDSDENPPRAALEGALRSGGFPEPTVTQALDWLETLETCQDSPPPGAVGPGTQRIFAGPELARVTSRARGFLLHLQHIGVLDATQREIVIERLLALDEEEVDVDEVQWVTLLTLFRQPGQEAAFARMEDFLYADLDTAEH